MKVNRTIMRTIDILELLAKNKEGYSLTDISKMLNVPKSSVFDIIKTLVYRHMVVENHQSSTIKYKIGLQSFLIGSSFLSHIDIVDVAREELILLANKMNATTFMAVLDDYKIAYIYKYESQNSIITTANIGTRGSLHSTGLGKVLMAFSSQDTFDNCLKQMSFEPYTPYTITSIEDYLKEINKVKRQGYALDNRENSNYQFCAAAPIRNHQGDVIAAISCSGLYDEFMNLDDLGIIVKDVADKISAKLGYKYQ